MIVLNDFFARVAVAHGAIISPRSRQSIDYLVGVNTPKVRAHTIHDLPSGSASRVRDSAAAVT